MKIIPATRDLANWAKCLPRTGDLLFFGEKDKKLAESLHAPVMTVAEARAQSLTVWTLNYRSWYGYSLNQASFCVWMPTGALEKLDPSTLRRIGQIQIKIGTPTLISSTLLPMTLRSRVFEIGKHSWVTSRVWNKLNAKTRVEIMRAWMIQNEIHFYSSMARSELPDIARSELDKTGMDAVLNHYAKHSGPNCFAAAAASVACNPELIDQWLHWGPFKNFLKSLDFVKTRSKQPREGDALVFFRGDQAVHAAYYLGEGVYLEKPGQDFYEPYRIERFNKWKAAWPKARLEIWRRDKPS